MNKLEHFWINGIYRLPMIVRFQWKVDLGKDLKKKMHWDADTVSLRY